MLRYSLTSLQAAKGRLLLTALAIVLGVGVVAGTFVLIDTADAAADAAFRETTPRADVVVRAVPQGEGEVLSDITGELFATPMPASTVGRAERVDGVAAAVGVVSGDAQLLGRDGHVVGVRAPLGRSIDASFAGSLRAGRVPTAPGEVAIDRTTADDQGFGVGDQVRILPSGGEPLTVTVVGVLDTPEIPKGVVLVGFDPATARRLLAPSGRSATSRSTAPRASASRSCATGWRPPSARATRRSPGQRWPPSGPATPRRPRAATASSSSPPAWSRCSPACS
jgi:putative ABC transport system permease protein